MTNKSLSASEKHGEFGSDSLRVKLDYSPSQQSGFTLDVNLELPGTGITMIYGASGSGKTSLLRCVAGLEQAPGAEIVVAGKAWQSESFFVPTHQRSLGFVFQDASLFPFMTVEKNLTLAMGAEDQPAGENLFEEITCLMGIQDQLTKKPAQLSGGERQRVAIARALLQCPSLLLFDEPLASLDKQRKEEILPYLDSLQAATKTPILYVTHSDEEVLRLADHLVVLEHGACKASGSIQDVAANLNLPFSNFSDRSAVFSVSVSRREKSWGMLLVEFEGGALWLGDNGEDIGALMKLRIRASDVSIALTDHQDSSILNRLPAKVVSIQADADSSMSLVKLQVGGPVLLARVSNWSLQRLGLQAGQQVWAQLKAVALAR